MDGKGRKTFHIQRMINGRRFAVSTRCTNLRSAMTALAAFEADPECWRPGNGMAAKRLTLDDALIDAFYRWSLTKKRNTPDWVAVQKAMLEWWRDKLKGRDLRKVTLREDVIPALQGMKRQKARIAVLKVLYTYLRKVTHALTAAEDPTLDLSVPQAKVAQHSRSKVISIEDEAKLLAALDDDWSDRIRLLSATGMHVTELVRFRESGTIDYRDGAYHLVRPWTKAGGQHRIAATADTAAIAKRVLAADLITEDAVQNAFRRARVKAGLPKGIGPGMFRHTLATRMVEAGATPESVAAYLHHRSKQTTLKFYASLAVIPLPATRTKLRVVS